MVNMAMGVDDLYREVGDFFNCVMDIAKTKAGINEDRRLCADNERAVNT